MLYTSVSQHGSFAPSETSHTNVCFSGWRRKPGEVRKAVDIFSAMNEQAERIWQAEKNEQIRQEKERIYQQRQELLKTAVTAFNGESVYAVHVLKAIDDLSRSQWFSGWVKGCTIRKNSTLNHHFSRLKQQFEDAALLSKKNLSKFVITEDNWGYKCISREFYDYAYRLTEDAKALLRDLQKTDPQIFVQPFQDKSQSS